MTELAQAGNKTIPYRIGAYDLSLEIVIVGVRGGGKTLFMSYQECEALRRAWIVNKLREIKGFDVMPRQKVNIWSNYPVKFLWHPHFANKPILLQSEIFDRDKLMVWDKMFHDGIIFFDEIDQVADRQDWFTIASKFLTAGIQVIRHRNLSLVLSIQSLEWLNARLQWQADVIIKCRDLAFTPWGKERNLGLGEVINTAFIDKSGILTGMSFEESGKVYYHQFMGKWFHNTYSTIHEFDVAEHKTKINIIRPEKTIDLSGKPEQEKLNQESLNNTIAYFLYNNQIEVNKYDFWEKAREFGFQGDYRRYYEYLNVLGASRKGSGNSEKIMLGELEVTA